MQIAVFLSIIAGIIIFYSCQEAPTAVSTTPTAATITGSIIYNNNALPGINVYDRNAATQTTYTTDSTGTFFITLKLTGSYTASLVFTDPSAVYYNDTVSVTVNPGDTKNLGKITLIKKPLINTTISGTVSYGAQLLSGMKVVDTTSANQTAYYTDSLGRFTVSIKLISSYTANLVISDPNGVYNNFADTVQLNPGDKRTLPMIALTKKVKVSTTVSGTVSSGGQALSGVKVMDINSINPTIYTTDSTGNFTIPFQLTSQYTATLVVWDLASVYVPDTVKNIIINPGDTKTLPLIILTKSTSPKTATTVTGNVSYGGQLLAGMKVVDVNSANPTTYITDSTGSFTIPYRLSSAYTAMIVISDPISVYNTYIDTVSLNPGDLKVLPMIILAKKPIITATITGSVSYGGQLLSNIKVVDINSANQTAYYTNAYGSFTVPYQLTSQYTACLVISDPSSVYNPDTVKNIILNPYDTKVIPLQVLTKSVNPKLTTTITGSVSCNGLLLSGLKIIDINSTSQVAYYTDSTGGFTITLKLTSQYIADLVISDPTLTYSNDTVAVTVNPGDAKILSMINLTKRKILTTISGTVSSGGQFLSGMQVVDINSANPTIYTTDSYGSFAVQLKLASQYTAELVIVDPNSIYNNDTLLVTVNPGDLKVFPNVILTKSNKVTTTITGTVNYGGQLLSGIKIIDLNSKSPTASTAAYYTGSNGSFTYTLQLSSSYTAKLLLSDPTSTYNNDTVVVTVNPGDTKTLPLITLSKNPKVTTTITGTVSYNGQLLQGMQWIDLTSTTPPIVGSTNVYGSFTDTLQLSSQYTAHFVISDPTSLYNNDTIAVTVNPGDTKVLPLIVLTINPKVTTTITGSVSFNGQLLSNINVVDINSANQTIYTTDQYGSFTETLQLSSLYTARLIVSDLMSVYNPDTITVSVNPGNKLVLPLIVLTKNTAPRLTTTITGTVNYGGQLLAGMQVVDINSTTQTTYTTNASGSFTLTLQLTSPYTARLVISDPNSVYSNDTVGVTVNPGDAKILPAITLTKSGNITTTITGSVSYNGQLLPGMQVVDINSAIPTVYTTDVNGSFTVSMKLIAHYTANLVISDPNAVYNNDTVSVPVNPGNVLILPMITLTKNTSPKKTTTINGTVSYNGQLLSGMKVVDINSANPTAYYTDASGNFTVTLQLSAQYTARLVISDPTATYNSDTTASILLNPGTTQGVTIILTKNASAIRTANQVSVISMSTNHIYSKGVGLLEGNSQLENCQFVLQVKDSAGNAIAGSPSYKAKFSLLFYPADGAYGTGPSCNPDSTTTDENGQLQVTVASGTCPGGVQLVVQVLLNNGSTINFTYITRLNIYSGFADQSHFSVAPTETYPNGWVIPYWGVYQSHVYSASVADTFGYAVPSGHAVNFISTPGGPGKIGNNGITITDVDGNASVTWIEVYPTPSYNGYYTTSDPTTSGRRGYAWLQAQTMGKNGSFIRDSVLVLWNEGSMNPNQPAAITMTNHTHSGIVDTLTLWDSNGNPINGTITATVDLGSDPVQGESFEVEGDIGSIPITIPRGDYRVLGQGNTKFAFGIYDNSNASIPTAGTAVTIDITITSANYAAAIVVYVPVIVN